MQIRVKVLLAFLILGILLVGLGCRPTADQQPGQDTRQPVEMQPGDYFPLTADSYWRYQGIGMEYAAFNREVLFTRDSYAQVREENGGTVSTSIYLLEDGQVKRIYFEGETYFPQNLLTNLPAANDETVLLKAPLKVGNSWDNKEGHRRILATNTRVSTPSGIFTDCLQVEIKHDTSTTYEYYKKGVGLVKREFVAGENKIISTLEDYSVK